MAVPEFGAAICIYKINVYIYILILLLYGMAH